MIFVFSLCFVFIFCKVALRFQRVLQPVSRIERMRTMSHTSSGSKNKDSVVGDNNKKQNNIFMNLITKNSLLVSIMVLSYFIAAGFWIYCLNTYSDSQIYIFILSEHFVGIDAIVNCICMSLQFNFMDRYYHMLCGKLHDECLECSCCCLHRENVNDNLNIKVTEADANNTTRHVNESIEIVK